MKAAMRRWEGAELARADREPAATPPPTLFGSVLPARAGSSGRERFVGATLLAVALHAGALLAMGASASTRMGQSSATGQGGGSTEVAIQFMVPRPSGPRVSASPAPLPHASRPAPVRRRVARPAPVLPAPIPANPVAPREPVVAQAEATQEAPANNDVAEHAGAEGAPSGVAGQGGSGMLGGGAAGSFEGQGGLVPPPPPPTLTREQRQSLTSRYLQELFRSRIATRFQYPREAEDQGLEGLVTLRVSIDSSGQLLGMRVQGACPHRLLCDAALRTVRESVPFPPPPAELGGSIAVDVPFQYRLE